jgi:crotonobetainyl-CoA:carnitine CoA-transferase CaiB-like acyl-CoA transferase
MLLSDMGADVIKVEQPGLGDYMRSTPPTRNGRSPVHATVNRNKRSIGIDLKEPDGKRVMNRLLKKSDIFVEGFRPGAMARLGFSFETVKKTNPNIVYCSISAYGQKESLSAMPGHDINFQAMAGTLEYTRPAVPLLQLGDMASGMYAALGILGSLVKRRGAVFIDVPIVGSLMSLMVIPASAFLATGHQPREGDSLVFGSTPYYNLYRTRDGKFVAVAAIEEAFWKSLVGALGAPHLEHKRFGSPAERLQVTTSLKRIFARKSRDEWAKLLMSKDTCVTPVLSVEEALTSSWAKNLSMLVDISHGDTILNGPLRTVPPSRRRKFTGAPSLGRDTKAVMKTLGYSARETSNLIFRGIVQ